MEFYKKIHSWKGERKQKLNNVSLVNFKSFKLLAFMFLYGIMMPKYDLSYYDQPLQALILQ